MPISKLPSQPSQEKLTIKQDKYFYNAFIDLARRYKKLQPKKA
jgi:hypothetical protein